MKWRRCETEARQPELAPEERVRSPTSSKAAQVGILAGEKGGQRYGAAYSLHCDGVMTSLCHHVMGQVNESGFLNGDAISCDTEGGDLTTLDSVAGVNE